MKTVSLRSMFAIAALLAALPAVAMYKVVGPDGKVTYTDVPPSGAGSRVVPMGGTVAATPSAAEVALPGELKQAMSRYPVTLYSATNCEPCGAGRRWLRERGIPFSEKTVTSGEDVETFRRITGSSDLPALMIGPQVLKGLSQDQWASYLDAAGYPRTSQLPRNYQYPSATPIVERKEAAPRAAAPPPQAPAAPEPPPAGGFKF
jgi:glutaredoxin